MPTITLQNRVYAELWISFASLIRSYVAAHDLSRPVTEHALVDEREAGHLTLRGDGKILALAFEAATGAGSWTLYEDDPGVERALEQGKFKIGEDSLVELSDRRGKLELEVAAEAFTAKVFDEE
ncbi:MAG TPA: DUF5110 domain-containing protein [Silvibacterium sp.]|nr:DUF5110 domain-containing protein [Silvibacterium sp.]